MATPSSQPSWASSQGPQSAMRAAVAVDCCPSSGQTLVALVVALPAQASSNCTTPPTTTTVVA